MSDAGRVSVGTSRAVAVSGSKSEAVAIISPNRYVTISRFCTLGDYILTMRAVQAPNPSP